MVKTAKPSPSARNTTQAARVAHALTLAIHQHKIAPGTKLGEDELGEIYGVSRTIIRDALRALSHHQLVEVHHHRGAFVARPSVREAREVFEARELVEPRTAHRAAKLASAADVERLRQHITDEHAALARADNGAALHLSGLFHIEIARIAEQATIARFIEALVARSSLIIALYWRRRSALCEEHAHEALINAIAQGDGRQAEELMHSHMVDLHSALDLSDSAAPQLSLRDALMGHPSA